MRFAFIHTEKARCTVQALCRALDVSPSGFYAWCRRPESAHAQRDRQLRVLIRASHEASRYRYGSPRVHEDLIEQGVPISRKRVVRLMRAEGLTARVRKRFKCTTMSDHDQPVAANVLGQDFVAEAPNQRWVGDTTEFVIGSSGTLYLAAILDLYSRFLVGWAVSAINDRHLVIKALRMALKRREPAAGLLHHSDQGSPYASQDYQRIITAHRMTGSMSRRGNCYDNAVMESWFSTVKHELGEHFDSCGDAKMALFDYIEVFYNHRRRHSTLGQISPAEFERRVKRPRFSWTRIKGESNVQGGGGNGSVEGRGTGRGIGTDGGSPEGDWSPCRRRGGRGSGGAPAGSATWCCGCCVANRWRRCPVRRAWRSTGSTRGGSGPWLASSSA